MPIIRGVHVISHLDGLHGYCQATPQIPEREALATAPGNLGEEPNANIIDPLARIVTGIINCAMSI
jgi:hypothetical protein